MNTQAKILHFPVVPTNSSDVSDINEVKIKDLIERVTRLEEIQNAFKTGVENSNRVQKLTNPVESETYISFNNYLRKQILFDELADLLLLEKDWDGFNALPISKKSHLQVNKFLSHIGNIAVFFEPFPLPNGGIGLEIHIEKDNELLLSFSPEEEASYVVASKGEVHRGTGIKDITKDMPSTVVRFLNGLN